MTTERPASGGARVTGVSFSDSTSTSDVAGLALLPPQYRNGNGGGNSSPTIMEGVLKKRGANLPVMRDRYCVATWEAESKFVLLRTYKSQKSFTKSPEKPVSAHALKCFGAWDGKGNFHRYDHAFLMETTESKVFFCTAPTEAERRRWIDVMKTAAAVQQSSSKSDVSASDGENDDEEEGGRQLQHGENNGGRPSIAKRQSSRAVRKGESSRSYAFEADSGDDDGEIDRENGVHSATDSEQFPDDSLFRSSSGADSVLSGSDRGGASKAEPADWGIFGESFDGPTVSKYDVVDRPVLLLDDELLNGLADKAPLASDSFLFEDAGPSRFGAVMVKKSGDESDDDLADFVDEELAARLERERSEKQLRKRVQKLESNRDLYAEMAAARLNSMRKDARHPTKKSPREFSFRPSQYVGSVSEYNESEDGYSQMTDAGYDEQMSEAGLFAGSEASFRNDAEEQPRATKHREQRVADEEEHDQEDGGEDEDADPTIQREIKKKKKKGKQALESRRSETSDLFEPPSEDLVPVEEPLFEDYQSDRSDGEEEVVQIRQRKSKSKKPSHEETSIETAPTEDLLLFETPDSVVNDAERDDERYEEERRLEKERRREERRVRKEKQRREEEEAAAVAAAELARQHRDAMREREDEKARKREKKERRERRELAKLEKEKKLRKSKEAELQAEVERLRLVQLQQKVEDEKKERKKKRRDKEKYSTPAERIQRKEREAEAHAAEMSSALVLVETPSPAVAPASVSTPVQSAAPAQDPQPAPMSASTSAPAPVVEAPAVIKIIEPTQPPHSAPAPVAASPSYQEPAQPVFDYQAQTASVPAAPQSQPAYPMMPQFIPGYPAPPQTLPMYTSPPPYGMYQPQYLPQPYYPPQYANMAYGSMQPQYYQPPVGYMSGAPMMGQPYPGAAAYPDMPSSMSGASHSPAAGDEPVFIGPKLPSPKAQAPAGGSSSSIGPPPPPLSSNHMPRSTSPALPDLPDLPDIADF